MNGLPAMYSGGEAFNNQLDTKGGYTSLKMNGRCQAANNGLTRTTTAENHVLFPLLTAEERNELRSFKSKTKSTTYQDQTSTDEERVVSSADTSQLTRSFATAALSNNTDKTNLETDVNERFGELPVRASS